MSNDKPTLIRGGQGHTAPELRGSALSFGFCALLGALLFAGGCFAQWFTRREPPILNVAGPVVNVAPAKVNVAPAKVNVKTPDINVTANIEPLTPITKHPETPNRTMKVPVRTAPVCVLPRQSPPAGKAHPARSRVKVHLDRFEDLLPPPMERKP